MIYLIASDIHGSLFYAEKVLEIMKKEKADKLVLLGDLYYHGPRNPLTKNYAPLKVSEKFNEISNQIIAVKGNCDSEVDEFVSHFKLHKNKKIKICNRTFFFTHGHVYNETNFPLTNFDVLVYGHFHTGFIKTVNNKIIVNPGSVTLPKNNTPNSYVLIKENKIFLKTLSGKIIDKIEIN